jgi:universal stress protein A
MSPFSHILVLVDCSSADDAIFDLVIRLADGSPTKVTLVHVVHSHTLDQDRALKKQAVDCLGKVLEKFDGAGIEADELLLSGEPETELEKEINKGDYDLIAMGTHGHKGFTDALYGSVSRYLKHAVAVPLLMVKNSKSND